MTELTGTTVANTRTVEGFLNALQDADYEAADAALADDLVYENVGLPTIHGRARAMKLFRQMEGRAAFEVKIHRIAADGGAVLTERTDALIFGPAAAVLGVRCVRGAQRANHAVAGLL